MRFMRLSSESATEANPQLGTKVPLSGRPLNPVHLVKR
jgi:hypothetical protein